MEDSAKTVEKGRSAHEHDPYRDHPMGRQPLRRLGTGEHGLVGGGGVRRQLALARGGAGRPDEPRGAHRRGSLLLLLYGAVQRARQGRDPAHLARHDRRGDLVAPASAGSLAVVGDVPLAADDFTAAEDAKASCPVSQARTTISSAPHCRLRRTLGQRPRRTQTSDGSRQPRRHHTTRCRNRISIPSRSIRS